MSYQSLHPDFQAIVDATQPVQRLATGMAFTEGPVWLAREAALLFTDIPNNAIMRWHEQEGLSCWSANAHFAIGLYCDQQGRLLACEHSRRRLVRYEANGVLRVLASHHSDAVLNSTNDLCVRPSDGAIFFTDPPFGVRAEDGQLHGYQQAMEYQGCGVFCVTADPTQPHLVTDQIYRPNGLCFAPDEQTLYVGDSSDRYHQVYALTLHPDQTMADLRVFCVIDAGVPDGMRVDSAGRLYVAAGDGVHVFRPDGLLLGKILIPEMVTNLCFGGSARNLLFATAVSSLYCVALKSVGV